MFWANMWDMVKLSKLRSTDYLRLVKKNLPLERTHFTAKDIFIRVDLALGAYVAEEFAATEKAEMFDLTLRLLEEEQDEQMRVIYSQALMGFLSSEAQVKEAVTWVETGRFKRKNGQGIAGA